MVFQNVLDRVMRTCTDICVCAVHNISRDE